MIPDLLDSIVRPGAYRRFAAEKAGRTARYVAFLSLFFVGGLGVSVKLRLAPLFAETFTWLETSMPPLQFSSTGVTSAVPGPLRLQHPRIKEIAVMIDTARKEPVTPKLMDDEKVAAYLTGSALYVERGAGQIESIDLAKTALDSPVTVDAAAYKSMERTFDWVFYPALMLFFFLAFALSLAACGALYALLGLLLASAAGGELGFAALLRIAVHAQTAGSLLYALDGALPQALPYFQPASMALSLAFLWLGTRAAVKGVPREPGFSRRMRRRLLPALAASALSACNLMTSDFRLSGAVDVSPRLRERAPRTGATLYVVAENSGGVPVAVLRVVNPEFPAAYKMGPEDLIVPALPRREALRVHAEMNASGEAGAPRPGDLEGSAPAPVFPGAGGVDIVLDRLR